MKVSNMLKEVAHSRRLRLLIIAVWSALLSALLLLAIKGEIEVPQSIDLLGIQIRIYSIALLAAVIVGALLVERFARSEPDLAGLDVWEGLIYVLIPGMIGARLYHVLTDYYLYISDFGAVFSLWSGGVGVIGAVVGGLLGLFVYSRRRQLPLAQLVGIVALAAPVSQAIGRLGNFFNYELFGIPSAQVIGMFVPLRFRPIEFAGFEYFHPLFLYEAIGSAAIFALLYALWRRGWRGWKLFALYINLYLLIRFALDFLRIEGNNGLYGLTYSQWLALVVFAISAGYLLSRKLKLSVPAFIPKLRFRRHD